MDANRRAPMLRASATIAFCALLAACAGVNPSEAPSLTRAAPVAPNATRDAVVVGKSTKRDVMAALGKTAAVTFDSGYEIWVYHLKEGAELRAGQAEYLVLFDPSGVVTKTRTRPSPAPSPAPSPQASR